MTTGKLLGRSFDRVKKIFYYKRCLKDNISVATFQRYLKTKHGILYIVKKAKANVNTRKDLKAIKILKDVVSEKDFLDSLHYLIITYNLPYLIIK